MKIGDATLHLGDCREVMASMPDASVDSIVCDPPYELGFMGKSWDASGIAYDPAVWREALRVLKPGGHLLAFSGSRTYHRMVCAIEDAGFEVRDQIMWVYGSGFPKSHNGPWGGTALKPAHEPICVARKPLVGTVAANVLAHGTGALNIDGCRVHADDAQGGAYTVKRFAPGASVNKDGNWKQDVEFTGEMKPGRWPANLIHDGSDEVLAGFPADRPGFSTGGRRDGLETERASMAGPLGNGGEVKLYSDTGSAARFFYTAKADAEDRHEGIPGSAKATGRNHHPTVKPTDLMRYLCRLVTPPGGLVLDPFMGSGSTGKAALLENFRFVGIELMADHIEIARARIDHARRQGFQPDLLEAA